MVEGNAFSDGGIVVVYLFFGNTFQVRVGDYIADFALVAQLDRAADF